LRSVNLTVDDIGARSNLLTVPPTGGRLRRHCTAILPH
jgi:hypothetical protein